jgi:alpha-beta hydrolase superfamily lysophospholipase
MEKTTFTYPSATGLGAIHAVEYPLPSPRAAVVLCHGMLEHIGRYDAFARFLQRHCVAVWGADMAGHGHSTSGAPRGYFARGGYRALVEDIHTLRRWAQAAHPVAPVFLMGHSMGSLLVRAYCVQHPEGLSGLILMGTSGIERAKTLLGRLFTRLLPPQKPSMLLCRMTFSGFNSTYPRPHDTFSWISRDAAAVDAYKDDALRLRTFCARGYYDLSALAAAVSSPAWFINAPKGLPMLFLSGSDDPVGQYGKGVGRVAQKLGDAGVKSVAVKLYHGARHELLNEFNRDEVMEDILGWIDQHAVGQGR